MDTIVKEMVLDGFLSCVPHRDILGARAFPESNGLPGVEEGWLRGPTFFDSSHHRPRHSDPQTT